MSLSYYWKDFRFRCLGTAVGLILNAGIASAQTTRFWNGTISSDWFNATNWIPNGVPAPNDIVNITNGSFITLTGPVTISNQFNWSAGFLMGTNGSMTIASNATMIINTAANGLDLANPLTNAGTIVWSNNAGGLDVLNNNGAGYAGLIANQPGALWDIQCDQSLFNNAGTTAYFYNSGTLRKSAGSGSTFIAIPLFNSGSVTDLQGTLNFQGGGPITGTFAASAGTGIQFSAGNFTNAVPIPMNGPGTFQLTGGSLWLLSDIISNLVLANGTVYPGPAFQGGTITNLTISGAALAGTNTVTGNFIWSNGIVGGGPLTIASTGVMEIMGISSLLLTNALTNAGTVIWTNAGGIDVANNNGGGYAGLIENLPGGLFDIQCDQTLQNNAGTTAYFHNAGTLRKSGLTGSTFIAIPFLNSGSVTDLQGTLSFSSGAPLSGTFTAAGGATIDFTYGGNVTNSGPVSINGPGTVELAGANLFLLADTVPNFPLSSGTVYPGPAFQGGTITNLTLVGATLAGTNTVTGTLTCSNGIIGVVMSADSLTIAPTGVLNLDGTSQLQLDCPLTNAGIVNWTNNGALYVFNNGGGFYSGLIENLSGALFDIQCDQGLLNTAGTTAYFHNVGTLRKSALTGFTSFAIPLFNSGNVIALQGTLGLGGGGPITGTFTAAAPATIDFYQSNYTNSVPVTMNGPGINELTGNGNLWLLSNAIPNLLLAGGTIYLGPAFEGGTITNLTISGAILTGTNTVTGTFNWDNGIISGGSLTISSNGVMNMNPTTTMLLESPLTNFGTVAWTNTTEFNSGGLELINNSGTELGLIENLGGALFDMQCDETIYSSGPGYFHNTGTLQKSAMTAASDMSLPVTNSGTISALSGEIVFGDGFTPIGGSLLYGLSSPTSYGTMFISGNATLGGTVGVLWLNGFVPGNGNSFTVLNYGSHTGVFTNFTSPPGAQWTSNYTSTSFTLSVASINILAFTAQPVGKLTNVVLAPIVVQIEDPTSNAVPVSGIPITVSLNSGSGPINGTLSQNTDSSGKATFGNLSFPASGTKTLLATSPGLTSALSVPFQILPFIGLQSTNTGFLIQLNGNNNLGPVTIYASTNLDNPSAWIPIYTNAATNGSIQFLDTSATNYRYRFYHILP